MVLLKETFVSLLHQCFLKNFSPHWNEKIGGKREIREKKRARKKGGKVFLFAYAFAKKLYFH